MLTGFHFKDQKQARIPIQNRQFCVSYATLLPLRHYFDCRVKRVFITVACCLRNNLPWWNKFLKFLYTLPIIQFRKLHYPSTGRVLYDCLNSSGSPLCLVLKKLQSVMNDLIMPCMSWRNCFACLWGCTGLPVQKKSAYSFVKMKRIHWNKIWLFCSEWQLK